MSSSEEPNIPPKETISRHPLFVLFVGAVLSTILTTILVPIYQKHAIKLEREEKARTDYEHAIYEFDSLVNTHLNSLITGFEFSLQLEFHEATDERRGDYALRLIDRYEEFDKVAWWKLDALNSELAGGIRLDKESAIRLGKLTEEYETILQRRAGMLKSAWGLFDRDPKAKEALTAEFFGTMRAEQQEAADEGRKTLRAMIETACRN